MGLNDVIIEIILICIFLVLGVMYLSGKCNFLIPKYRLLSDDMKKRTDTKRLSRLFGFASLFAALSIGVMITGGLLKIHVLFFGGIIMLGADVFYLFNKGNHSENFLFPKEDNLNSENSQNTNENSQGEENGK